MQQRVVEWSSRRACVAKGMRDGRIGMRAKQIRQETKHPRPANQRAAQGRDADAMRCDAMRHEAVRCGAVWWLCGTMIQHNGSRDEDAEGRWSQGCLSSSGSRALCVLYEAIRQWLVRLCVLAVSAARST